MAYKVFPYKNFLLDLGVTLNQRTDSEVQCECRFCDWDNTKTGMMGINELTGQWGCWYSDAHKGANPVTFVMQYASCSKQEAIKIVQEATGSKIEDLRDMLEAWSISFDDDEVEEIKVLDFPKSFAIISQSRRYDRQYVNYLISRGFNDHDIRKLVRRYGFRCTSSKQSIWQGRLIVPIVEEKKLITWQGRHVGSSDLRWLSLSEITDLEKSTAVGNIKEMIFLHDKLKRGGNVLVISEGVFDAVKVDFANYNRGIRAGCLFGKCASESQIMKIKELSTRFKKLVFVLDAGTGMESVKLAMRFPSASFEDVPYNQDDLGDLSMQQAYDFGTLLLNKYQ